MKVFKEPVSQCLKQYNTLKEGGIKVVDTLNSQKYKAKETKDKINIMGSVVSNVYFFYRK